MGLLLAAPAQAKCCPLDHLVVTGPGLERPVTILGTMLDDQLHPAEQGNLYWPLLNGSAKGDHRPGDDLGRGYDITYVLGDVTGDPIEVHETVYLEADPPVAFAPKGQTQELYPGDVREVPWGWRPFPERAANALMFLMEERGSASTRELGVATDLMYYGQIVAMVLVVVGALWFFLRRRRVAPPDAPRSM